MGFLGRGPRLSKLIIWVPFPGIPRDLQEGDPNNVKHVVMVRSQRKLATKQEASKQTRQQAASQPAASQSGSSTPSRHQPSSKLAQSGRLPARQQPASQPARQQPASQALASQPASRQQDTAAQIQTECKPFGPEYSSCELRCSACAPKHRPCRL